MRRLVAAFLFSTVTGTGFVNALPLLPVPVQLPSANVIAVAGGCGPGFHRARMAAADRTTPTPPHTPVPEATTSGRADAAAATADRFRSSTDC